MLKSLGAQVLFALVLGLAIGIAISATGNDGLIRAAGWIEPVGTIWINAIRMTVVPLVVGAIIVGVASAPELKTVGSLGGRAVVLFLVMLLASALFTVLVAPAALSWLHIDPAAATALRASAAQASTDALAGAHKIQSPQQWLIDLIPINPIKAAADGAMLPLIVFSLAFGLAASRIQPKARDTFVDVARAVTDASLVLVRWILAVAPIGVLALSVAIALRLGVAAAGAVIYYIALVALLCTIAIVTLFTIAWLVTRGTVPGLARFWAAPMAVAFSSRSSMVALPTMIESAASLQQPPVIRSFFLPLAVSVFRVGAAINIPIGVLFLARLYGIDVSAAQLLTIALTTVLTTFSVPGIPGGSIIVMVPVLLAANLPVEGIGILLGVDTLPDMFRTTTNVTGDMAVASLLTRSEATAARPMDAL